MVLGTTNPLAGLLRRSPFEPIQEHMRKVFTCVALIPSLFDALFEKEQDQIIEIAEQIGNLETEADMIKSGFRLHMPATLLLPVARRDLLSLINHQDSLADNAESIGLILLSRDMEVPEELKKDLDELLEALMAIALQALNMIEELDELLVVGFGVSRERNFVKKMIATVRREENKIDKLLLKINRTLFAIEKNIDPVNVMFWYKILELLGNISNDAEDMADRVLLFMSK
jgi:hypothetical protein